MRIKACEAEKSLQIALMCRFCNFEKTKLRIAICKLCHGKPGNVIVYHADVQIIAANVRRYVLLAQSRGGAPRPDGTK